MGKCFREMQILPPPDELVSDDGDGEICVPVNIVGAPYPDSYTYFDTQFRLIREDLLEPYREAVKELRRNYQLELIYRCMGYKEYNDFQVYRNVEFLGMKAGNQGIEYGVSFNVGCSLDWEKAKLLMNNTLLCVSQDGFLTFFWATVCNRDMLEKNIVGLMPVDGHEFNLQKGAVYSMFESTRAYYEAYMHVLKVLQRPQLEDIQFTPHFVYLEPNIPELDDPSLNWHKICKCDSLDGSQEAAINQGLTKKLALIQGPPGTGKTYTGLLIVKALIHKIKNSSAPILVVCYTNRALDQFLEGIYAYEKSIARLGSRTQSLVLSKRTLPELMNKKYKKVNKLVIPNNYYEELYRATQKTKRLERAFEVKCSNGFVHDELSDLSSEFLNAFSWLQKAKRNIHACLLSRLKVVGMTTTFAARNYDLLASLKSEIMVVEEAAEALEGHILGCLNPCINHLILIGDHKQLGPSVASQRLADMHNLEVSMFERLVSSGIEYHTLAVQRRMRPAISAPLVSLFYPMLRDHDSVHQFQDVKGVKKNTFFIDHWNPEDPIQSSSRSNAWEADMVVQFCLFLTKCCGHSPSDITILSMYRAQTEHIMQKINYSYYLPYTNTSNNGAPGENTVNHGDHVPRVRSVDEFQGEESNIILLSLVRNINSAYSDMYEKTPQSIGFLKSPNRICVALSRARLGLYIFGNAMLLSDSSEVWKDIIQHFSQNDCVGNGIALHCARHPGGSGIVAYKPEDLREYNEGKTHFCIKKCKEELSCGHKCPRKCHFGGHKNFQCKAKCLKMFQKCEHVCKKICHADSYDKECPPCQECRTTDNVCDGIKDLLVV